jgi:hypothetical protein
VAISLVQHASGSSTSNAVTITLAATGANNALIVAASYNETTDSDLSGITLGGSAAGWSSQVYSEGTDAFNVAVWANYGIAGGQTSLVVTGNDADGTSDISVDVYEVSGLAVTGVLDKTAHQEVDGSADAWSSTATATTSQAAEFILGWITGYNNAGGAWTITGPSSPWANEAQLTPADSGGYPSQLSGYQIASGEAAFTYSGTTNTTASNLYYQAGVATFKGAGSAQAGPVFYPLNRAVQARRQRLPLQGRIRSSPGGPASTKVITATGKIAFQPFGFQGYVPGTYSGLMDSTQALPVLDAILLQQPVASVGGLTLRLGSTSPGPATDMTELPSGNGYTQGGQSCAFSAASGGTAASSTALSWTNTSGGWEITGLEFWDESEPVHGGTGVRWLFADWSGNPIAVAAGNTLALPPSSLSISMA